MKLDLTRPTIVLTGIWNPAIFQIPWMAMNLFEKKSGESFNYTEVHTPGRIPLIYSDDVGIGVSAARVELYINSFDPAKRKALEQFANRIIELLPHTPMAGFGVNIIFEIPDPEPELIDKLKTQDQIETKFKVDEQVFVAVINRDQVRLTWRREKSVKRVGLDFNFHHSAQNSAAIRPLIMGSIEKYYEESLASVTELYGEQEITFGGHVFPEEQSAKGGGHGG